MIKGVKLIEPKWIKLVEGIFEPEKIEAYLSEVTPNTAEALVIILNNKLGLIQPAIERRNSFLGRVINRMTMEDPDSIEVDGNLMISILKSLDEEMEPPFHPRVTYLIPFQEAEKIVVRLKNCKSE